MKENKAQVATSQEVEAKTPEPAPEQRLIELSARVSELEEDLKAEKARGEETAEALLDKEIKPAWQ